MQEQSNFDFQQEIKQEFETKNKCPYCGFKNLSVDHVEKCKKESPLISVIIPSRVGEKIETIKSLENQTYKNIETIIEYDEQQEGASVARNRGAKKAKGEFLFFCDNDVVLNPNCLSDLYLSLKSNPKADWVFGKFYIDEILLNKGRDINNIPLKKTIDWIQYFHSISTMSLIRAEINPKFDEEMKKYNDWDLWLTLHLNGHQPVFCDEVLFYTYNRKGGISMSDEEKRIVWTNKLYEKYKIFVFRDVLIKNKEIKRTKVLLNDFKEKIRMKEIIINQLEKKYFLLLEKIKQLEYNSCFFSKELKRKIKFAVLSPHKFIKKYLKSFLEKFDFKIPFSLKKRNENLKIVALITMRNESKYIERCIKHLYDQGVYCYIIDNDSIDNSKEIAEKYLGKGVLGVERFPYPGFFSLKEILKNEERLAKEIDADWFMHYDSDEIREAPLPYKNLKDAIIEVDRRGYNAINFDEFAFTPTSDSESFEGKDFVSGMKYYYYLAKWKAPIHIKCWKKTMDIKLAESGGHDADFPGRKLFPTNFILRHYPVLSKKHAIEKYCKRKYDEKETKINWHAKRSTVQEKEIELPSRDILKKYNFDRKWDKSDPWKLHYFLKNTK